MTYIRIKDNKTSPNKLVYQGPAEVGCECVFDEQLVGSDPTSEHGSLEVFLSAEEARKIAQQLLHHAATIESGVPDESYLYPCVQA